MSSLGKSLLAGPINRVWLNFSTFPCLYSSNRDPTVKGFLRRQPRDSLLPSFSSFSCYLRQWYPLSKVLPLFLIARRGSLMAKHCAACCLNHQDRKLRSQQGGSGHHPCKTSEAARASGLIYLHTKIWRKLCRNLAGHYHHRHFGYWMRERALLAFS